MGKVSLSTFDLCNTFHSAVTGVIGSTQRSPVSFPKRVHLVRTAAKTSTPGFRQKERLETEAKKAW